jgi:acyl-CoA thioester hydrolase
MRLRVYYEDVDAGGICYHSKYLNFCERARSELFFSKGLSPIDGEYHFVVKHIDADFFLPAKFGDMITVQSSLIELKGASIKMLQEITNQNSMRIFGMQVTLVCLKGDKVSKIPDHFKAILHTNSEL